MISSFNLKRKSVELTLSFTVASILFAYICFQFSSEIYSNLVDATMKSDRIIYNAATVSVINADRVLGSYLPLVLLYKPKIKNGIIGVVIKNDSKNGCPVSDNNHSII